MLQENLAFFKCCNVKCCKLFRGTKIVANSNVANFLGKFALLQKPIVAKKKTYEQLPRGPIEYSSYFIGEGNGFGGFKKTGVKRPF